MNNQHGRFQILDETGRLCVAAIGEAVPCNTRLERFDLRQEQHCSASARAEARQTEAFWIDILAFAQELDTVFYYLLERRIRHTLLEGLPAERQHNKTLLGK